ncbi:BglG family transcription antiterminator [Vagococcus sp. BWB3-3]|uniref:Ascorbate-specific PTS system EIIA component n=1 Tax=Vagococcus allomyrinae TaxID=2794353 RepID=A0A940P8R0_9ENTE|nr:BglG family transcription antiterminator [Vagococcus allomyrinae]MBP1043789.1 BglG family transcription antiterminator [Vagococcus allomyrinae]
MKMDSMTIEMIEMIVNKSGISMMTLLSELGMTKGQLTYRLKKINEQLMQAELPVIQRKNQRLYIELTMLEKKQFIENCSSLIHFSDQERLDYILLMLIFNRNQRLASMAETLIVSKNTVLSDMRKIKQLLRNQGLDLIYSRKNSYAISGKELDIRRLAITLLKEVIEDRVVFHTIQQVLKIDQKLIHKIETKIGELEQKLNVFFSEGKLIQLSYVIYMCVWRTSRGEALKVEWLEKYVDLSVHQKISEIFSEFSLSENELQFITIQILGTNTIQNNVSLKDQRLMAAIFQSVANFERLSITQLEEREELCDSLYQHLIPAIYRIKFGVPDFNSLSEQVIQEYDYFHDFVRTSIQPIEELMDLRFPEQELAYLTIIFLSFLKEELRELKAKQTAIVVCIHGISVSRLLLETLKELFPQLHFIRFISLREFYEQEPAADFIFSTVYLDTDRQTFIIKHFLSEYEKRELKQKVESELNGIETNNLPAVVSTDKLIGLIERYGNIADKEHLEKALNNYLSSLEYEETISETDPTSKNSLLDLLPLNHIQFYDKPLSLAESILLAGKPLVNEGLIEPKYLDKIIADYNPEYPYFVVAPETAIPHAGFEDGVNKLSMSLLKLTHPVAFSQELSVRLIVLIAPEDQKGHMNAVSTFYTLVHNSLHLKNILSTNYEKELRKYLEKVLQEVNQEYVFK